MPVIDVFYCADLDTLDKEIEVGLHLRKESNMLKPKKLLKGDKSLS